jgi:threonine aldolase
MPAFNRKDFLKASGLAILPAVIPAGSLLANNKQRQEFFTEDNTVYFYGDGRMFEPAQYLDQLQSFQNKQAIERDRYGSGGAVAALEKKFEEITGKEKAMFMPSGTMANQLAIAVLSGENTKVFVQDTSHVYRDEADAAQSVFKKRLMPLANGETYFTADMLKLAVESLKEQEVFTSGVGAISIENPVRRTDGRMVPLDEIKKISEYCRSNNIRLHLDGARLHMTAAWSGSSIKDYASYFDTVYISLYKYLGASAGAILCGEKKIMEKMPHLVKIHGGSMYGNWTNAAMALGRLEGIEKRLADSITLAKKVFAGLNSLPGVKVTALDGGTNIYSMQLPAKLDARKLNEVLSKEYFIRIPRPDEKGHVMITVNDTWLNRDADHFIAAFKHGINVAGS